MKSIFLTLFIILLNSIGYSQLNSNANNKFIIGIGNSDVNVYKNVLTYLEDDPSINVYAICDAHHIIGFKINNSNANNSYDFIRDNLLNQFEDLILNRKDDSIFKKDCRNELEKQ